MLGKQSTFFKDRAEWKNPIVVVGGAVNVAKEELEP